MGGTNDRTPVTDFTTDAVELATHFGDVITDAGTITPIEEEIEGAALFTMAFVFILDEHARVLDQLVNEAGVEVSTERLDQITKVLRDTFQKRVTRAITRRARPPV